MNHNFTLLRRYLEPYNKIFVFKFCDYYRFYTVVDPYENFGNSVNSPTPINITKLVLDCNNLVHSEGEAKNGVFLEQQDTDQIRRWINNISRILYGDSSEITWEVV